MKVKYLDGIPKLQESIRLVGISALRTKMKPSMTATIDLFCRTTARGAGQGWTVIVMLEICPMTLKEANAYVEQHHRHHGPVAGHKFSIGLSDGEKIVGVAIVGRPVSRHLDDGWTLEVNRLCTDGTRNACSMLYAAAWRAARSMGYKRLVTYILDTENGASLRAAGWKCVGQAGGLRWTGRRRPEVDLYPAQMKIRFEAGGCDDAKEN